MTTETDDLNQTIQSTYEQIQGLTDHTIPAIVIAYAGNREVLVETLLLHRKLTKLMKEADSLLETELLKCPIQFGGERINDHMVNVRRVGAKSVFDNAAITGRMAAIISVDVNEPDEDGIIPDRRQAAEKAALEFANLVGCDNKSFSGWRKTVAKSKFGVDLDKYQEKEGGRLAVEVVE